MRQLKGILILLLTFLLTACGGGADVRKQENITVKWPIYQVEKDGKVAYILGTNHVGEKEMYPFPKYLTNAIDESNVLITEVSKSEIDSNNEAIQQMQVLPVGQVISDVLSPEAYEMLEKKATEYGVSMDKIANLKPYTIANYFTNIVGMKAKQTATFGVEQALFRYADEVHIQSIGFETAAFQMALMEALMPTELADEIIESIPPLVDAIAAMEQLTKHYRENNQEVLIERAKETPAPLLIDRNKQWVPIIEDQLKDGKKPFVAVGFLHLIGEDGLIDLFEKAGYAVTLVEDN